MPNIRILAKAVLQIFCSHGCSYTKCQCPKRGLTQPKIYGIGSKFNQFINTLVCNYMPNIRILAKAVLMILCSQCCSYTKCLCPKSGITQPKIYGISSKVNQFIYILVCKYQDSSQSGSSDILFTRFFIQSRKRGITPERQDWWRKTKYGSAYFSCTCHIYNFKILA